MERNMEERDEIIGSIEDAGLAAKKRQRGRGSRSRASRRRNKRIQKEIEGRCQSVRALIASDNFKAIPDGLEDGEIEIFKNEVEYMTLEMGRSLRKVERDASEKFQVEGINKMVMQRVKEENVWQHNLMYEVKWSGYEDTTLEPVEELEDNVAVESFWQQQKTAGEHYKIDFMDHSSE